MNDHTSDKLFIILLVGLVGLLAYLTKSETVLGGFVATSSLAFRALTYRVTDGEVK